jgi:hypothetical protein
MAHFSQDLTSLFAIELVTEHSTDHAGTATTTISNNVYCSIASHPRHRHQSVEEIRVQDYKDGRYGRKFFTYAVANLSPVHTSINIFHPLPQKTSPFTKVSSRLVPSLYVLHYVTTGKRRRKGSYRSRKTSPRSSQYTNNGSTAAVYVPPSWTSSLEPWMSMSFLCTPTSSANSSQMWVSRTVSQTPSSISYPNRHVSACV